MELGTIDTIWQFIKLIIIIVGVHEFGHFIAARMTGMRADVFAIGMGRRLFGWNKITGFTWGNLPEDWDGGGHTDYRLCLLPIGGYVKIRGMIDESMDTDQMATKPEPWEFRSKNAAQKAFVLSAGVIMNFILAIAIYTGHAFFVGKDYTATTTVAHVAHGTIAKQAGFMKGDRIRSVNGVKVENWDEFYRSVTLIDLGSDKQVEVSRDGLIGGTAVITLRGNDLLAIVSGKQPFGLYKENSSVIIGDIESYSPAEKAGIKGGDTILSIKNVPMVAIEQMQRMVAAHKEKKIPITYKHKNTIIDTMITPTNEGRIGVQIGEVYTGATVHRSYGIGEALMVGLNETWGAVKTMGDFVGNIASGAMSASENVGGPIEIATMAKRASDSGWDAFLIFTALISVNLGIINLLPIPALDGGHLVVVCIEAILRRELSLKAKTIIQQIGMFILFGLMGFVIIKGIIKIFL
ncbi:MAG: RIP metalloprotease RseP [Candidatus Kapabacteria bacterium]|nr:RIP metalloprotease RseP [Candidatus Kapabacteria bacterium]